MDTLECREEAAEMWIQIEDYWAFNARQEERTQVFWINVASKRTFGIGGKKEAGIFQLALREG